MLLLALFVVALVAPFGAARSFDEALREDTAALNQKLREARLAGKRNDEQETQADLEEPPRPLIFFYDQPNPACPDGTRTCVGILANYNNTVVSISMQNIFPVGGTGQFVNFPVPTSANDMTGPCDTKAIGGYLGAPIISGGDPWDPNTGLSGMGYKFTADNMPLMSCCFEDDISDTNPDPTRNGPPYPNPGCPTVFSPCSTAQPEAFYQPIFQIAYTGDLQVNISWLVTQTDLLTISGTSFCGYDATQQPSFEITTAPIFGINLLSATNVSCFGEATGALSVEATGGTAPYTYSWTPGGQTTSAISGLTAGVYSVTATDATSLTVSETFVVSQPAAPLAAALNSLRNVSCVGGSDGSIDLGVTGGTSPYAFLWSPSGSMDEDLSGLSPGTAHSVVVTDTNGCTASAGPFEVYEPDAALTASGVVTQNVLCNGGMSGEIDLTVSGGWPPYSFSWNNGAVSEDLTGVMADTYSVVVTDDLGCTTDATGLVVTEPSSSVSLSFLATDSLCPGSTGAVESQAAGGTPGYTYAWQTGATTANLANVPSGQYQLTVSDSNSCQVTGTATVGCRCQGAAQPVVTILDSTDPLCNGQASGSVDVSTSQGAAPYTYLWNNGATTEDLNGVVAGSYSVTVTDAVGCSSTSATAVLLDPPVLAVTLGPVTEVSCAGGSDGAIDINVAGGTAPYTYLWSNGATTQDLNGVAAGSYSVTVTDQNGCTQGLGPVSISGPANPLVVSVQSVTNVTCPGGTDGAISLSVNGGQSPYTVAWNPSAPPSLSISSLSAGTWTATVTDDRGCQQVVPVVVSGPAPVQVTVGTTSSDCPENTGTATVVINGGSPPFTIAWDGRPGDDGQTTISNLGPGVYTVTVTDRCGSRQSAGTVLCTAGNDTGTTFLTAMTSPAQPAVGCDGVEYCLVTVRLSNGLALQAVNTDLLPFGPSVSIKAPPAINPFYAGVPFDGGCSSGISIFNPDPMVASCGLSLFGTWDSNDVTDTLWKGSGGEPCINYDSMAAPSEGTVTIPVAQFAYENLGGSQVGGTMFFQTQDQVLWPYTTCCGCGCTVVQDPTPPFACNIPVDFNTEVPQLNAASTLNQAGFISFPFTASQPVGTFLRDPNSGYTFRIIGGSQGFNNVFQNTFPATPNNLLLDGVGETFDTDYVGVSVETLPRGSYEVKVWIFDQDDPALAAHFGYWGTFDPRFPGESWNRPTAPAAGPFDPQPRVYNPTEALGADPGPFAGSFLVYADGEHAYQLLVRSQLCDRSGPECKTRFNGFQLTLIDETPPELTCNDVRIDIEECETVGTWCEPSMISDNCPLPDPGLQQTPIFQTGGPPKGSTIFIGNYDVSYAAVDPAGNTGSCTFELVIADVLGPSFTSCVDDITMDNLPGRCFATPTWENPPANTNCDEALNFTYMPYSSGDEIPVGTHDIVVVASDNVGRSDSCSFEVTILDVEPPVLCVPPQDATLPCGPAFDAWLTSGGFAQWDDNCPVVVTPHYDNMHCGEQPVITGPVTWTTVANPTLGPQTTVGPANFATADASCVCNVMQAHAEVEPAFVDCASGVYPELRNVTITLNGTAPVLPPAKYLGVRNHLISPNPYVPPLYRWMYNLPGQTPVVIETTEPRLELRLPHGRYSFVVTDPANNLMATVCVDIPLCGLGVSEMWLIERPSDSLPTQLVRFDHAMRRFSVGATQTATDATLRVNGIAFRPTDGVLFGVTSQDTPNGNENQLVMLDQTTGQGTLVGPLGSVIQDLSFVGTQLYGVGYMGATQLLYRINTATGVATFIGGQLSSTKALGLATGPHHQLYVSDASLSGSSLYRTAATTGASTFLTQIQGSNPNRFFGPLAFDQNNQLFAIKRNFAGDMQFFADATSVVHVDIATGETEQITATQTATLNGIAFRYF